jgi:hypothetical protein
MSEASFTRPTHRQVHAMLSRLDSEFLARVRCFFGGGTRIVPILGTQYITPTLSENQLAKASIGSISCLDKS